MTDTERSIKGAVSLGDRQFTNASRSDFEAALKEMPVKERAAAIEHLTKHGAIVGYAKDVDVDDLAADPTLRAGASLHAAKEESDIGVNAYEVQHHVAADPRFGPKLTDASAEKSKKAKASLSKAAKSALDSVGDAPDPADAADGEDGAGVREPSLSDVAERQ